MDLKEIINSKGPKGAAAAAAAAANGAAQDLHLLHSISQANSIPMSDTGSERGDFPCSMDNVEMESAVSSCIDRSGGFVDLLACFAWHMDIG